jgi:hypothetical protein
MASRLVECLLADGQPIERFSGLAIRQVIENRRVDGCAGGLLQAASHRPLHYSRSMRWKTCSLSRGRQLDPTKIRHVEVLPQARGLPKLRDHQQFRRATSLRWLDKLSGPSLALSWLR